MCTGWQKRACVFFIAKEDKFKNTLLRIYYRKSTRFKPLPQWKKLHYSVMGTTGGACLPNL